jgi:hypothetical protein
MLRVRELNGGAGSLRRVEKVLSSCYGEWKLMREKLTGFASQK